MKIGVDIDGVLAKFESGFVPILSKLTGIRFPDDQPNFPPTWDWPQTYGVLPEEVSTAWEIVKRDRSFWASLLPMADAHEALGYLQRCAEQGHDVYFITHRMGEHAKQQTERWLVRHGFANPTVMLVRQKHLAAVALQLDHFIDDRWENCEEVKQFTADTGVTTRVVMVQRPYNENYLVRAERLGIEIAPSLFAALERMASESDIV